MSNRGRPSEPDNAPTIDDMEGRDVSFTGATAAEHGDVGRVEGLEIAGIDLFLGKNEGQ